MNNGTNRSQGILSAADVGGGGQVLCDDKDAKAVLSQQHGLKMVFSHSVGTFGPRDLALHILH